MAGMGRMDLRQLKELQSKLNKISENDARQFCESCAKEIAARLLRKVIRRTPVGDYSHEITVIAKRNSKNHKKGDEYKKKVNYGGKKGGTLRRGWTSQSGGDSAKGSSKVSDFIDSLTVEYNGNEYVINIINPVEYASYVEYGHRTANHKGWVKGRFMMTTSVKELQTAAPKIIEKKVQKFLEGVFSDDN